MAAMQVRRRLARTGVAIMALSAGLTAWSGLASAGDSSSDKRIVLVDSHGPGGCNEDGVGAVPDSSL